MITAAFAGCETRGIRCRLTELTEYPPVG